MTTTIKPSIDAVSALHNGRYVTDGGLETTLVFHEGIDLPDFAAFPLLATEEGRDALHRYYAPYVDVAERDRVGIVLDTPTWRANADWGARQKLDHDALAAVNRDAVAFVRSIGDNADADSIVNGVIGPRGDGYVVGESMTPAEAASYHALQARAFAEAGADLITAVTMTYVDEAVGIVTAARTAGVPVAISFTVETDGRLPSGQALGEAIEAVDAATDAGAAYFMVNCAHPSHFEATLAGGAGWRGRIWAVRANASRMSHEELDDAEELDRGDPTELAAHYQRLAEVLPNLRLIGGCCGTDHEHVAEISAAFCRH